MVAIFLEGFKQLGRRIQDLLKAYKLNKVIVRMEPTGHYWFSLARWLIDQGIDAPVLVNPHLVKKNKDLSARSIRGTTYYNGKPRNSY